MYEPVFNSVLVQINDEDAKWGAGNEEAMLGKSYSKGTVIELADVIPSKEHPIALVDMDDLKKLEGKQIMFNEGVEAGTVFDFDGKTYGFIYWWDIRGVLADA